MKKHVKISPDIIGVLTTPEVLSNKLYPAILLLHGFGANKDEVGNTFVIAAEKLAEQNIISLRIDFSGFGDSPKPTTEITIDQLVKDANSALGYLLNLPN